MDNDSMADAMEGGGSEIPISSGAVMVLTAELLRLAGHHAQLIQLLHLDNVVRLARFTAAHSPRFSSQEGAEGADGARAVMPLPWAYREHLCSWMMEEGQESQREVLSQQVAAANSVVTLAGAPAVPALVALRMLPASTQNQNPGAAAGAPPAAGAKRDRLTSERSTCCGLAREALSETTRWLTSAQDARKRIEGVDAIFPAHLPQAAALTSRLVDALAAAAESGVLVAARSEMDMAIDYLRATAPPHVCARLASCVVASVCVLRLATGCMRCVMPSTDGPLPYRQDGSVAGGGGAAALQEAAQRKSKTARKSCRPSELAAFLRSAGTWRGGAAGKGAGAGQGGGVGSARKGMEELKKQSCVSDKTFEAWFPADAEAMEVEGAAAAQGGAGGAGASSSKNVGWVRVRSCCRALGVSAAEWAAVVEVNDAGSGGGDAEDEEAEAFEKADKDLTSLIIAAAAAGGREMLAASFPQRAWFQALSDLSQAQLEAVAALHKCFRSRAAPGSGLRDHGGSADRAEAAKELFSLHSSSYHTPAHAPGSAAGTMSSAPVRARLLSERHVVFFRAVVAVLQAHPLCPSLSSPSLCTFLFAPVPAARYSRAMRVASISLRAALASPPVPLATACSRPLPTNLSLACALSLSRARSLFSLSLCVCMCMRVRCVCVRTGAGYSERALGSGCSALGTAAGADGSGNITPHYDCPPRIGDGGWRWSRWGGAGTGWGELGKCRERQGVDSAPGPCRLVGMVSVPGAPVCRRHFGHADDAAL